MAWWFRGRRSSHSRLVERLKEKITGRWENKASQRRKIKKRREIKEITDPIDETAFQVI